MLPRYHTSVKLPDAPQPSALPATARRRLEGKPGDPVGKGCLLWGGVLGVIVGLTFAFYGLGPILRHFYGEAHVGAGETYEGTNFTIGLLDSSSEDPPNPNLVRLQLAISGERSWVTEDFKLQHSGGKNWSAASSSETLPDPAGSAISLLMLSFEVPSGARAEALHLGSPRVRFSLK
jgi:hypothetical protein